MQQFDIAIIGGGLVGASFARAIAGSGFKTLIIDKLPAQALYSEAMDNRGLALAYTTQQILQTLKCWDLLAANSYTIETVHVSEKNSFGFTKLNAASQKLAALGYVVSASNLGQALIAGLEELADLTIIRPTEIKQIAFEPHTNSWNLSLSEQAVKVKLLVAADGANSALRASQNMRLNTTDYQQQAIVTNISITAKQLTIAYERFTTNGVIALLPFGSQRVKCVWTASNEIAAELMAMTDIAFLAALQAEFGFRLGKFQTISERKSLPICQIYADPIYSQAMVLIGNAANTLHPVAAQGFNLGVRDAMTLAKILIQARNDNQDISCAAVLQQYAVLRQQDHNNTRSLTNSLVEVFAKRHNVIKTSRRLAIIAAQFVKPLNRKLIARGQGVWT